MTSKETGAPVDSDSITAALDVIGDRWSLLVLRACFRGIGRFSDLRSDLGIASNLLTTRLVRLVDAGVLTKVQYQERPARFEYRLTEVGMNLSPVLVSLMQWGDTYRNQERGPTLLGHADCGSPIENFTQCTSCLVRVGAEDIRRLES